MSDTLTTSKLGIIAVRTLSFPRQSSLRTSCSLAERRPLSTGRRSRSDQNLSEGTFGEICSGVFPLIRLSQNWKTFMCYESNTYL